MRNIRRAVWVLAGAVFLPACRFPKLADGGLNRLAGQFAVSRSIKSGERLVAVKSEVGTVSVVVDETLVGSFDCKSPFDAVVLPPLGAAANLAIVLCVAETSGRFFVVTDQLVLMGPTDLCSGAISAGLKAAEIKTAYFTSSSNCR